MASMDGLGRDGIDMMDPDHIAALTASPYPDQHQTSMPPQQDVDEFLRKKRKAREHKACYPCRQRKVKCDLTRPCKTCSEREHPELCSYNPPPNKRLNAGKGTNDNSDEAVMGGPGFVTIGRQELDMLFNKLSGLEDSIAQMREEMGTRREDRTTHHEIDTNGGAPGAPGADPTADGRVRRPTHTDVHGVHMKNDAGEFVHFGGGSIPAMLYGLQMNQGNAERSQIQEMLGKTVLPLFGLDNESATYPFVDLWGLPHGSLTRAQELAKALPSDQQMLHLFRCYRDMGYIIYAGIVSTDTMEQEIMGFLTTRTAQLGSPQGVTEQLIYGKKFTWLALLFAVLASGAQSSGMPRKERELTSQVYICCSFECLRFTNFLSQANLDSIQAITCIGNVMANNLNAGTAWALLGLTIRLAQGLGLHRKCPPDTPPEHVFPRAKIWWGIMWQDSLLSITYDRASTTALNVSTMPMPQQFGPTCKYHQSMYRVSKVGLDIVNDRSKPMSVRETINRVTEHRDALASVMKDSAEYLRDSRKCNSQRETLEHWGLYLHSSYIMSELCRPAISANADPELAKFKQTCIENLVNTVEAFLGLNNVTSFARQSWAALHRALGSALLIGIIGEHNRQDRAMRLVNRFTNVMADITNNLDPQEISSPIQRGLNALRKLTDPSSEKDGDVSVDGKHEGPSVITPASTGSPGEEHSPYSVLNSILWGNKEGIPNATQNGTA